MGSVGNQKSWTPYDAYKDCAEGICNIYCPQWCNYQPPLDSGDDSGTSFSPLIIAVIGILASAFLLVSYYAVITKYCRRRRSNPNVEGEAAQLDQMNHHDQLQQVNTNGLDEGLIKSITIVQYKKGVGLVEGTECSVCLNDFQENEDLRLLPKCFHAFHLPCIDTWLKSHSNCPLCRANAAPVTAAIALPPPPPPPPIPPPETSSSLTISASETRRQNDHLVLVIDQEELNDNQEVCVNGVLDFVPKNDVGSPARRNNNKLLDQDGSRQLRRSISLGTFSTRSGLMVVDILEMDEEDEEIKVEIQQQLEMKMDSSNGVQEEVINGGRSSDSEILLHK